MWIYITGYIASFIAFIILGLREKDVITFGDLFLIITFSFASWATLITILIIFLIESGFMSKPVIKIKSNYDNNS